MEQLPKEIMANEILLKLPGKDVFNVCIVSKKFQEICKDNYFWLQLLRRDFPNDYLKFNEKSNKDLYKLLSGLQHVNIELGLNMNLYKLYYATSLDLAQHEDYLSSLPKEIRYLTNLQELHLQHNYLKSLPKEIGNLTNLKKLDLSDNLLKSLPAEIGNLTNLKKLDLSHNLLKSLPKEMGNLTKLKYLYLNNNDLTTLPKEMGNLIKLKELNLEYNYIDSLPKEFNNLYNLIYCYKQMIRPLTRFSDE